METAELNPFFSESLPQPPPKKGVLVAVVVVEAAGRH